MNSHYYALIANPAQDQVLIARTAAGWTLPRLPVIEKFWWQDVGPINRAAQALFGWPVATRQCVAVLDQAGEASTRLVYALEPHPSDSALPDGLRWVDIDELPGLSLAWPEQVDVVCTWLRQAQTGVPWYRPGWREGALRWATSQMANLGYALTAEPEQVRAWERSALWRFHTTRGQLYFKAVTATFAYEPRLTQMLGKWHPGWFPPVLAIDEEKQWMLLGDAGAHNGNTQKSLAHWEAGLRAYGEMQAALVPRVTDLLKLGVPDRRLNVLPNAIELLLADTRALNHSPAGLSDDEVAALRARGPAVLAACHRLRACPIPASLEHGDFSPGQIVYDDEGACRFIDWSDSSVAFPFFGAQFFWAELEGELPDPAAARLRLRDAYLQAWAGYASRPELLEIFQTAMSVAPFYYATLYHQHLLPTMSFKWEMERMLPYYLRIALRA